MALVTTKKMFQKAYEGHYAIGAFNINNMEIIQAVVNACKVKNSAVILQVSSGALKYAGPKYLKAMVDAAIAETGVDILGPNISKTENITPKADPSIE